MLHSVFWNKLQNFWGKIASYLGVNEVILPVCSLLLSLLLIPACMAVAGCCACLENKVCS